MQHFEKKCCSDCDKNLIRIGDDWYELHLAIDCTKIKCQPIDVQSIDECTFQLKENNLDLEHDVKIENDTDINGFYQENLEINNSEKDVPNEFFADDTAIYENLSLTEQANDRTNEENVEEIFHIKTENDRYYDECSLEKNDLGQEDDIKTDNHANGFQENIENDDLGIKVSGNWIAKKDTTTWRNVNDQGPSEENMEINDGKEERQANTTIHNNYKLVTCSVCNSNFKSEKYLKLHLKAMHKQQYKYDEECRTTRKKFNPQIPLGLRKKGIKDIKAWKIKGTSTHSHN